MLNVNLMLFKDLNNFLFFITESNWYSAFVCYQKNQCQFVAKTLNETF